MIEIVQQFPNVVPFLIYIKKEDFHRQRFAVRAKYMTTDPAENRYISNFLSIRTVQQYLSQSAKESCIPKIDNRNIDRSLETMHKTVFNYLKKLESSPENTMLDPESKKLTFLNDIWKRRKQKPTGRSKMLSNIHNLDKEPNGDEIQDDQPNNPMQALMQSLPTPGMTAQDDSTQIRIEQNGIMIFKKDEQQNVNQEEPEVNVEPCPPEPNDDNEILPSETDPDDITLTDFTTTDTDGPLMLQTYLRAMMSGAKKDEINGLLNQSLASMSKESEDQD